MDHHEHDRATPRTTGEKAGEAAGGLSGLTAGAAIGSLAGPLGAVIGAVAGAVGGWWAVHAATAAHTRLTPNQEAEFRSRHDRRPADAPPIPYERARMAYQLGFVAGCNPRYASEGFADAEGELRLGWDAGLAGEVGTWEECRELVLIGFECARVDPENATGDGAAHGSGVEPLHADPATEVANRVHERVAERRKPPGERG